MPSLSTAETASTAIQIRSDQSLRRNRCSQPCERPLPRQLLPCRVLGWPSRLSIRSISRRRRVLSGHRRCAAPRRLRSRQHAAAVQRDRSARADACRGEQPGTGRLTRVIMHTNQGSEGIHRPGCSRPPAPGFPSPSRWGAPGRPRTTRSSNRCTPRWSSLSAGQSTSPPRPQRGPNWRPGSRTTTSMDGIRPARRYRQWPANSCWQPRRRQPDHDPASPGRQYPPVSASARRDPGRSSPGLTALRGLHLDSACAPAFPWVTEKTANQVPP
jgi:hypothetical protein